MEMKDSRKASEAADDKMRIIAPLLNENLDTESMKKLMAETCDSFKVCQKTVERYLEQFRTGGYEALKAKGREVKYKIPMEVVEAAIQLRREVPSRSVPTIIRILEAEGIVEEGFLKRSTLQDAFVRSGYSSSMMRIYRENGYGSQRFQREHRNDLWQGDIKYGPALMIKGVSTPTYFSCLIDDCTRYIVHGEFYTSLDNSIVEDTLHKAVMKFGAPKRLYFDNGKQYRNHWMVRACGLMGIKLIYAKPRNPQGKGKQERFNLTIEAFLNEIALKKPESIEEMNRLFNIWLDECYHSVNHSSLETTPEIAYKTDSAMLRFVDTTVMAEAFLHCETRKVDKTGCISFMGEMYDVGLEHTGKTIDVVFDPANIEFLTVETPGFAPFKVHKAVVGEHVGPKPKRKEIEKVSVDHSRLLKMAEKKNENRTLRKVNAISYTAEVNKEK